MSGSDTSLRGGGMSAGHAISAPAGVKIATARVRAVSVPLRRPVIAAIGRFDYWPLILLDLETTGGVVGRSYVAPYRERSVPALVKAIGELAAQRAGEIAAPHDTYEANLKSLNVDGLTGQSTIACAAIDMALWDALGKHAGLPLVTLLGGSVGEMRAYNSNGLWREEVSKLGPEARDLLAEGGFSALKLRLGNEHSADDLKAVAAVRDAIGNTPDLMVDFNQALGSGDAMRRCRDLDDQGLYWLEEPIRYDDLHGYRALSRTVRTPIQMGENWWGPRDMLSFVQAGATSYGMPDLMRIGGVSGWMRTAGTAAATGVQLSNHLYPEIAVHLLRATPTAHWLEWVDWAAPILKEPLTVDRGMARTPDRPGVGWEWDEAAVAKYAVGI